MDAPVLPDTLGNDDEAETFRQQANKQHRVSILNVSQVEGGQTYYYGQFISKSVHDVIYKPTGSPKGFDAAVMRGRWIHLTANNEKWIHDLMKKLKVRNYDVSDNRDRGYGSMAAINLHLVPQATRSRGPSIVALFMPVLGYDTHGNRKRLAGAFKETYEGAKSGKHPRRGSDSECTANEALILGYQFTRRPRYPRRRQVHPRQTLHRFGYSMITSTETKDRDQVSFKWAAMGMQRARKKSARPVIMVDQLWLWMLGDGTLITCYPESSSRYWNSDSITRTALSRAKLDRVDLGLFGAPGTEPKTQVVSHLVLRDLLDFGAQFGPLDFRFKDGFKTSINRIIELENSLFRRFTAATKLSHKTGGASGKENDDDFLSRSDLETNLLVDLMAIQDELSIIQTVQTQQRAVLEELRKIYQGSRTKANGDFGCLLDRQLDDEEEKARNLELMRGTLEVLDENAVVVKDLLADAAKVQRSVESLLTFKQMHANTMEARLRRKREETAERSENTLKAFGLISLLFLPLSFASSLFALDVDVFPKDEAGEQSWPIRQVMGLIFGISAGILLVLVTFSLSINEILAFSRHWRHKLLSTTTTPESTTPSPPRQAAHDSDSDSGPASIVDSEGSERSFYVLPGTEYLYTGEDDDSVTSSSSDEEEDEEGGIAPRGAGFVGGRERGDEEPVAAEEPSTHPSNPPVPAPAPSPAPLSLPTSAADRLKGRGSHSQEGGRVDVDVEKGAVGGEKRQRVGGQGVLEVGERVNCSPQ